MHRNPHAPIEQRDFDSLLKLVSTGELHTDRPVLCECDLEPPLDEAQLGRLGSAADQAESEGANRAVMIIDGRALVMDVPLRVIDTEVSARSSAKSFTHVDAAVYVAGADDDADAALPPFPGSGLVPGAVAQQLERALLLENSAAATVPQDATMTDTNS